MSPERISPQDFGVKTSRPSKSSDCYSLGMVIYEIISGNLPFHEDRDLTVFVKVLKGERPRREARFANDLWDILEQCWMPQPNDRPTVEDILQGLGTCSDRVAEGPRDLDLDGRISPPDEQGTYNSSDNYTASVGQHTEPEPDKTRSSHPLTDEQHAPPTPPPSPPLSVWNVRPPLNVENPHLGTPPVNYPQVAMSDLRQRATLEIPTSGGLSPVAPSPESLRSDSPHWSPPYVPLTPPPLAITDVSPSISAEGLHTTAPLINVPQGGIMNGPQLCIDPTMPISGGLSPTSPFINNSGESTFFLLRYPTLPLPFLL